MKEPTLKEYDNQNLLMEMLAEQIATELKICLKKKNSVTLAVPGGSTPKPFFNKLSEIKLDWGRVVVVPTDERFVPETNIRSNLGLIKKNLLQNQAIGASVVRFFKSDCTPEELSFHIASKLKSILPIDICILGMGSDMHVASIFPGADNIKNALDIKSSQTIVPITEPKKNEMRLTLTARVLREAPKIHFLLSGLDKRVAFNNALKAKDNWEIAPIRSVLYGQSSVTIHYAD